MRPSRVLWLAACLAAAAGLGSCGRTAAENIPAPAAAPASPHPAAASAPADPRPPRAHHMLFRARGQGATVYLLGSVHLLSADAAVLPAEVDSAFAHARTVVFEADLDSLRRRAAEVLVRGRLSGGATLRSMLGPAAVPRADSVLHEYGLTIDQMNQFKPWFVSLLMNQLVMRKAAFQPQYGVDAQLDARARQAGKSVIGLESADTQLGLFDRLPAADQVQMITMAPGPDSSAHMLIRIKNAWAAGNTAALDTLLNRAAAESPAAYAMLVVNRNRNWIPRIEQLLAGHDDALVVVGAAHLVGQQSVIALLRAKGYTIEQM